MNYVVQNEVIKLLAARVIYSKSNNNWVSPMHEGIIVVGNKNNEFIPTKTFTRWCMCVDYRKMNNATKKDHFLLPFIDKALERLANYLYFYYLDGYSGFFQIPTHQMTKKKPYSLTCMKHLYIKECLWVFAICLQHFNDA